jgi:hypothetical protein
VGKKRNSFKHILFAAECSVRQRTEQCVAEADPKAFFVVRLEKVKTPAGGVGAGSTGRFSNSEPVS